MTKVEEFFRKNKPVFKLGVMNEESLPNSNIKEVAFIGRSNVGKSSLINSITNSNIAKVSKTPGRTRQLNFFQILNKVMIVDMPGYGYAKIQDYDVKTLNELIMSYLLKRENLKRLFILVDSRHMLKDSDKELMKILDKYGIIYQIILTKIDELKKGELENKIESLKLAFKEHSSLFEEILTASSKNNSGIKKIQEVIYDL